MVVTELLGFESQIYHLLAVTPEKVTILVLQIPHRGNGVIVGVNEKSCPKE